MDHRELCNNNPKLAVPIILMASYLYYIKDEDTPITDHEFDRICHDSLGRWDKVEHKYKHLIDEDALSCGSLGHFAEEDYPSWVPEAAYKWKGEGVKYFNREVQV